MQGLNECISWTLPPMVKTRQQHNFVQFMQCNGSWLRSSLLTKARWQNAHLEWKTSVEMAVIILVFANNINGPPCCVEQVSTVSVLPKFTTSESWTTREGLCTLCTSNIGIGCSFTKPIIFTYRHYEMFTEFIYNKNI